MMLFRRLRYTTCKGMFCKKHARALAASLGDNAFVASYDGQQQKCRKDWDLTFRCVAKIQYVFPYLVPGDLIAFLYLGFRLLGIFDGYEGADDIRKSAVAAFYALSFCANAMKTPTAVYYFSDRVVACCGTVEALAALTGAALLSLRVDVLFCFTKVAR